jgi:endonuclease-3
MKKSQVHQKEKTKKQSNAALEERRLRLRILDRKLRTLFPGASIALRYKSPWELLVAVVLSAQCTDSMVNKVTDKLFRKYTSLEDYIQASQTEFEKDIHATGFFRAKAKNILRAARMVRDEYGGEVPQTMQELVRIPGVARKTANVVLGNAFGVVEGIAVDTHVKRFAIRFDLTDHTDPVKIEQELMTLLPKKDWLTFTYRAIEYGRQIAPARKYDTSKDPLVRLYPPAGKRFRV